MGAYTLSASRPRRPRPGRALRSRGGVLVGACRLGCLMRALEARHGARMTAPATGPMAGAPGGSRLRPARAGTWPIVARAPRGIPALRPCAGARQVSRIPPRSLPSGLSPARVCARLGAHSLSRSPPHTARRHLGTPRQPARRGRDACPSRRDIEAPARYLRLAAAAGEYRSPHASRFDAQPGQHSDGARPERQGCRLRHRALRPTGPRRMQSPSRFGPARG